MTTPEFTDLLRSGHVTRGSFTLQLVTHDRDVMTAIVDGVMRSNADTRTR